MQKDFMLEMASDSHADRLDESTNSHTSDDS